MLSWDEPMRKLNLKNYGFDFAGCDAIWDHFTVTRFGMAPSLFRAYVHSAVRGANAMPPQAA